ncbi:MAG: DUF1080 domain-containing protein [Bacteroidetes bacterium]|nr:MAG: DUF1080 domain-containing protein [Bacteroidota bacterium]
MKIFTPLLAFALLLFLGCGQQQQQQEKEDEGNEQQADEWILLFDGSNLDHWRNYLADTLSDKWQIQDGTLTLTGKGGGDIITKDEYENFELELEWKISEGGNSGVFFHVLEADSLEKVYFSGPEIQILDNDGHPDGKIPTHRAGDNYDLHSCTKETVKPVGEWNHLRVVVNNGHVEHWLNGEKVVEYDLGSPDWEARYQKSKFTKWPVYGRAGKGHIALQDHGDPVWFRNIRIRVLPAGT